MHSAVVGYGWIVPASLPTDTPFWPRKRDTHARGRNERRKYVGGGDGDTVAFLFEPEAGVETRNGQE